MTVATVKNIAKNKGISISMVSVKRRYGEIDLDMIDLPPDMIDRNIRNKGRGNTVEVDRAIRKYNRQILKITAALTAAGYAMYGRKYGNGTWSFTSHEPTASDILVWNNID